MIEATQRAIGYVRVSTQEQAESGLGLDAQERAIRLYCEMKGFDLVDLIRDEGVSAGKALGDRPGGADLLYSIQGPGTSGKGGNVIALKLDRLFRNAGDALQVVEDWDRRGVALHLVDQGGSAMDTSSAMGKFMLTVLAGVAEMERNLGRERTTAALAEKRQRGEKTGGTVPYGFDAVPAADGVIGLVENAAEQAVINRMVRLRREGVSLAKVARQLDEDAVPTKTGVRWHPETVRGIVARQGDRS